MSSVFRLNPFPRILVFYDSFSGVRINALVDLTIDERDHATRSLLQWFVDEQVEEESNAEENVRLLTMTDGNPQGTFMIDQQLMGRPAMTPPVV